MNSRLSALRSAFFLVLLVSAEFDCKHSTEPPLPPPGDDTTSHSFMWRVDTISGMNPSVLYDVSIVNDTCVWAVGEIYVQNPTGPYPNQPYGAAVWNGKQWTAIQVPYHGWGTADLLPGRLSAVWGFSTTAIYVCSAANLLKWDGQTWTEKAFFMTTLPWDGQVTKMWAKSESDIYLVGMTGSIYHYTGNSWQKMVSGTTVDLLDVWGDASSGVVWACGSDYNTYGNVLLRCENGQWRTLWERSSYASVPPFGQNVGSVWSSSFSYVASSNGVFRVDGGVDNAKLLANFSAYTNRLRGASENDIVGAGQEGMIWHYNGSSWVELRKDGPWFNLRSCDIKGNTIAAVGENDNLFLSPALMYIGKRE